jgi:lipid-binding SYLF domain-containing protein
MAAAAGGASKGQKSQAVLTYTKSRGLYGGVTVEGTSIKEKADVNAGMFGKGVTSAQILKGEAAFSSNAGGKGLSRLYEVVKQAEGKAADEAVLGDVAGAETPGDMKE